MENTSLSVELEKLQTLYTQLSKDYEDLSEKYRLTNNQRGMLEIQLKNQTETSKDLKENIKENDKSAEYLRKQIEGDEFKMLDLKREVESKKLKAITIEKQMNIKISHLGERLAKTTEMLEAEKVNRYAWTEKFEKEQKENAELSTKLLNTQSVVKDRELDIQEMKIKIQGLEKSNDTLSGKR